MHLTAGLILDDTDEALRDAVRVGRVYDYCPSVIPEEFLSDISFCMLYACFVSV